MDCWYLPVVPAASDVMNQTVFWSFAILGLFIWLVFRPFATAPWKILGAFVLLLAVQPFNVAALKASSHAYPLKYDYVLQSLDQALGLTAFQIARLFTAWERTSLLAIYEFLSDAMVVWYGIHVVLHGGASRKLLYAYFILFLVGGCLYGIVPAMGPRYAFGASFPMKNPSVTPVPTPLEGYPNAMPSLHVATAFLLVLFTGRNRWLLSIALVFLAGTVAATLAFEHYVVDLIVAVPFACFALELAYRRLVPAMKYLGAVLAWLGLIRFGPLALIQHPWGFRFVALFTICLGIRAVAAQWKRPRMANTASESVFASGNCYQTYSPATPALLL
jgi:PAP2 superfamily protein